MNGPDPNFPALLAGEAEVEHARRRLSANIAQYAKNRNTWSTTAGRRFPLEGEHDRRTPLSSLPFTTVHCFSSESDLEADHPVTRWDHGSRCSSVGWVTTSSELGGYGAVALVEAREDSGSVSGPIGGWINNEKPSNGPRAK